MATKAKRGCFSSRSKTLLADALDVIESARWKLDNARRSWRAVSEARNYVIGTQTLLKELRDDVTANKALSGVEHDA